MELSQAREEREMTLHAKDQRDRDYEVTSQIVKKALRKVERLVQGVRAISQACSAISEENKICAGLTVPRAKNTPKREDVADHVSAEEHFQQLERFLTELESIQASLGDWLQSSLQEYLQQ